MQCFFGQVSLNEGGHQLRLYHGVPDASVPFNESCQVVKRVVPGASLLVRLVKARIGLQGHPPAVSLSFCFYTRTLLGSVLLSSCQCE